MATAIILILLVLALIPVAAVILCALVDRAHLGVDDEVHLMTTHAPITRRSPRRHLGAWVVALSIAAIQTAIQPVRRHFPSVIGIAASNSPAGGGAHNSGSRSVVAHLSPTRIAHTCAKGPCAERDSTSVRVVPAIRGDQFNADRAAVSPIGDQARFSRGRRLISPAFRSEYRATGSVRLSGDSHCTYSRMKSLQNVADAGSIPATSTTTGVHGFDGTRSVDGRLAMVPAVSGSAESGVRCDGPNSQTPMTAFIGLRRQPDVPAARNGTKGRHLFNAAAAGKVDPRTKAAA